MQKRKVAKFLKALRLCVFTRFVCGILYIFFK